MRKESTNFGSGHKIQAHVWFRGSVVNCPPPLSEMNLVGGQLRKQNNHFFPPYLHQVKCEGVPLE